MKSLVTYITLICSHLNSLFIRTSLCLGLIGTVTFSHASDPFRILVERNSKSPTVIHFNPSLERFELHRFTQERLQEVLNLKEASKDLLESETFRVVEGQSEETLPVTDLDGRNVLYHLERARKKFLEFDSLNSALFKKTVVRVRVEADYNIVTHFAEKQSHNNSRYIHANYRGLWGSEIWFHKPMAKMDWRQFVIGNSTSASGLLLHHSPFAPLALIGFLKSFTDNLDEGMDLAKIPSVIYHEAFHWATDSPYPFDRMTEGNPIKEDYANYFGTSTNGSPLISSPAYMDSKRFRDFRKIPKVNKKGKLGYNFLNFIPSVLWKVRTEISDPNLLDQWVWNTMKLIRKDTQYKDLPRIWSHTLDQNPSWNPKDRVKLKNTLENPEYIETLNKLDEIFITGQPLAGIL